MSKDAKVNQTNFKGTFHSCDLKAKKRYHGPENTERLYLRTGKKYGKAMLWGYPHLLLLWVHGGMG
jgi:hypothetical protein